MKIAIQHQLSIALENQPGRLAQVGRLLAERGVNIEAVSVIDNVEQGMVRLITSDHNAARDAVATHGFPAVEAEVLAIITTDRLGRLAEIAQELADARINIEYAYASVDHHGAQTLLIMKTSRPRKAYEILVKLPES
jgi:hypothetical protein